MNIARSSTIALGVFAAAELAGLSTHANAQPVNSCGVTMRGPVCSIFQPDGGGKWYIGTLGSFTPGQRLRISGVLDTNCMAACPGIDGCVTNIVVQQCVTIVCVADFDQSGAVGLQDLFAYLQAYFANVVGPSPPGADIDHSGAITLDDLFQFLAIWFGNCP